MGYNNNVPTWAVIAVTAICSIAITVAVQRISSPADEGSGNKRGCKSKSLRSKQKSIDAKDVGGKQGTLRGICEEESFSPPLPSVVVNVLKTSGLSYLATVNAEGEPHLSLMAFTYVQEDEKIVLSTRRDTKKANNLLVSGGIVSLLIHDGDADTVTVNPVEQESAQAKCTCSITLVGEASVESGERAERYRAKHLENNPKGAVFINGDNIAIVTVKVLEASICNSKDKVKRWTASSGTTEYK
ncbi:hypothetical protein SARC_00170 [Sphaeroforma arctica JP610]|uniref:Pyridoxamine 5'-phosphate oxidase N-terminal domain-containing protein n=1 Tax=Sphaeroforma arctica JP610 TaxID=667725 RepID=A0A0L0GFX9_9EUKA|nr:hypothetical protein SARC_00170 [Sphaeroforma arctica JP610]KNC87736.1 hypothetical protein SARC_00170 [Sphaeroforma arctica JP610]|eukprot:XP_014161638.1 hypothetical protein SARC_00170 [Sphaeroforma arctica JP610]